MGEVDKAIIKKDFCSLQLWSSVFFFFVSASYVEQSNKRITKARTGIYIVVVHALPRVLDSSFPPTSEDTYDSEEHRDLFCIIVSFVCLR